MGNKRQKDVLSERTGITESSEKRTTFSKAMIRLGAYVTYCVIFLLKKLNKILCDSAKAFTSGTTALILGVIKKLKKAGRVMLTPFVSGIKLVRAKFAARRAETDMTVSSIRTTRTKQFFTKAVNYAVPAAAITAFAFLLGNASNIENGISTENLTENDIVIDSEAFIAASNDLEMAESIASEKSVKALNEKVCFEEPFESFRAMIGTDDVKFIDATGVYIDDVFMGSFIDVSDIKKALNEKIDAIRSNPDVKAAVYKKKVTYQEGRYPADTVKQPNEMIEYINGGSEKRHYTIEPGDSLGFIAEDNGMTLDELLDMNPDIYDPDLCVIGTDVIIACDIENMPVLVTKDIEETVMVPFETMTVETDELFVGETEILIDGISGEAINTVEVCYDGDFELKRKIISTRITVEPVTEMVSVGVKQQAYNAKPDSDFTVLNGNGQYIWPVNGGWISDCFGSNRNHKGMDIAAPEGTEIYAAGDGQVIAAGWNTGGYGYFVMIDHGNGYATLYGHMSKVIATNGSEVKCGDIIGEVGTTGDSTGNHLHFEVRYKNVCQNPANYISVNADIKEDEEESKLEQ